jgi:hypothetical protein
MLDKSLPHIIEFPRIGDPGLGFISVAEKETLPFEVKRVYWTYHTPENIERGKHAHYDLEQILIAITGSITVSTEMPGGIQHVFVLDRPNIGLYIPRMCWRDIRYSAGASQVCLANMEYDEADYIRDYQQFKAIAP